MDTVCGSDDQGYINASDSMRSDRLAKAISTLQTEVEDLREDVNWIKDELSKKGFIFGIIEG
jgi:hypothetical protein